ncbi:MAG: aminotransferase class I/II-fold pyridoxal phosphate-dependent enzyme [Oscillospiraceae bacterium]|nr:aminotransferase class I/II-fold pyridoxal phosphate-dependent enzyme [Oscillospiraceae bacterium]
MDIFDKCYGETEADVLREKDLFPYFKELQSRQDTEVIMEGKRRIMMGSNNYLGLTVESDVIAAGIKALEEYGTGCSGSRLLNGTLVLHQIFEREIAAFLGKEDAVTFPSGFQSNLGAISAVVGPKDYVICDKEDHASIIDACRLSYGKMLRYRHSDMADLEFQLKKVPDTAGSLIVTDGVFSMSGEIANLPDICALAKQYGARVMVDDAHALGVIGEGGRGTADWYGLTDQVDMIMGTFSKSLASLGGYVVADARVIDYIRCFSRPYIFAASIPPASIAVATAALRHLEAHPELPEKLRDNARYMRFRLREARVDVPDGEIPIIPVYTYGTDQTLEIQKELFERGVYVNATLPPACPEGQCLLRCSLMATHTREQIDEAVDLMADVLGEYGLTGGAAAGDR